VFRRRAANRVTALVANIPMLVPAAMSFCKYHLLHHRHMGELTLDADIPGPIESRVVGTSVVMKTLWVASLGLIQGSLRPLRLTTVGFLDVWTVINLASQGVAIGLLLLWMGPEPLKYLGVSTVMAIGLHPLGARWIQEHYVFKAGQETYSYYGPLNRLSFNVGYHNEHHDLITVPWSRLPEIRQRAPEFYEGLHAYGSWTGLLLDFVSNRQISLFDRMVRPERGDKVSGTADVQGEVVQRSRTRAPVASAGS